MRCLLLFFLLFSLSFGCVERGEEIGREVIKAKGASVAGGASIAEIIAKPDDYNGKVVVVSGKVLPGLAFEFISEQPYQIIQGESLLWVITSDIAPKGEGFVTAKGKIVAPYQIKGRSYPLVLIEERRL